MRSGEDGGERRTVGGAKLMESLWVKAGGDWLDTTS